MQSKLIILACLLAISQSRVLDKINIDDVLIKHRIQLGGRIIGGRDAQPGEFPHQVSLQIRIEQSKVPFSHFCGGSILSDKYILTAAHCLDGVEELRETYPEFEFLFAVKAGKQDLSLSESTEQVSMVEKYVKHEKWDSLLLKYDVAVLKLQTPLQLNKRVAKIRLPKKNSEPTGDAVVSGWGAVNFDNPKNPLMPKILQTLNTPLITRIACNEAIEKVSTEAGTPMINAHRTTVCTGPLLGGTAACVGDSGGPLILNAKNGQPEVVGIVSWSPMPCARKGGPVVYAKVSVFIDWIKNAMKM